MFFGSCGGGGDLAWSAFISSPISSRREEIKTHRVTLVWCWLSMEHYAGFSGDIWIVGENRKRPRDSRGVRLQQLVADQSAQTADREYSFKSVLRLNFYCNVVVLVDIIAQPLSWFQSLSYRSQNSIWLVTAGWHVELTGFVSVINNSSGNITWTFMKTFTQSVACASTSVMFQLWIVWPRWRSARELLVVSVTVLFIHHLHSLWKYWQQRSN